MNELRAELPGGSATIRFLICLVSFVMVLSVMGCDGGLSGEELEKARAETARLMRLDSLDEAARVGWGALRQARPETHYDSVRVAYLALYLGHVEDRRSRRREALRAYERGGRYFVLLSDSLQVVTLRWAATLYGDAGRIYKARTLAIRSIRLAGEKGYTEAREQSISCLLSLDEPVPGAVSPSFAVLIVMLAVLLTSIILSLALISSFPRFFLPRRSAA